MNPPARRERRLAGLPVSGGVVLARVHLLTPRDQHRVPAYLIARSAISQEKTRLQNALRLTIDQLDGVIEEATAKVGPARANIFVAQKLMAADAIVHQKMMALIEKDLLNAEAAVDRTLDTYEALLYQVDNEYIKERSSDIGEIRRRLLEQLRLNNHVDKTTDPPPDSELRILIASELTPSETLALDSARTVGFITERGGPVSHAAILARALGIPSISGIQDVYNAFSQGEEVLMNGDSGEVIVWPSDTTRRVYPSLKPIPTAALHAVDPVAGLRVMASINLAEEALLAKTTRAEGIGLYRSEFELLAAGRLLSEEEQYQRYARVLDVMDGQPVYIRLFDLGGDKPAPFLQLSHEENPSMGFRGARLLLGRPELIVEQARALARASRHGPIHVIYPMITGLDQFLRLRELVRQSTHDLEPHSLLHGVMLEVPSACLSARDLLAAADFSCIGSNDLIQYLFAVDRNNSLVAADYTPKNPVFWTLLAELTSIAREAGKPISLCGEIAGNPQFLPQLLELGITIVSVNPRSIALARTTGRRYFRTLRPPQKN